MIAFKNHSGFTLVETLAALAIFALVATPIFLLESSLTRRVAQSTRQAEMVLEAKKFLYDTRIAWQKKGQEPQKAEKKIEQKRLTLRYIPQKIESASSLKSIYGLWHERVTIEWTDAQGKQTDELVAYRVVVPAEEKDKK
jgi:prepilin-type N-terminal cleavage/methylation domain-containing protein